jgi:hypothetical protein
MLQMTLHFTRSNRLWDTFTPSSRSTSTPLRKKNDDKISLINNNHLLYLKLF